MVAVIVVVVVLVLFNLPQLQNLRLATSASASQPAQVGTSPQAARQVAGGGGQALVAP